MYKIFSFLLIVACYLLLVIAPSAQAETMSNDNYIIQMQDIDTAPGITDTENSNLKPTSDNSKTTVWEGVNFKAKAGFENLTSKPPFSISLSSNLVDFGFLSPTNPIVRTVDLSINSDSTYGYSVLVFENKPLATAQSAGKILIPDTTCDNGACGTETASEWTNTLTYGFGYRCDNMIGNDCDSSFKNPNFYKHFPDLDNNDDPQSIMAGVGSDNKQIRVSYKINISGNQAQGVYSNTITYLAIPNF